MSLEAIRVIKEYEPSLIHLHNYYLPMLPHISAYTRRVNVPLVAQFHGHPPLPKLLLIGNYLSFKFVDKFLIPLKSEAFKLVKGYGVDSSKITLFPNVGVSSKLFKSLKSFSERDNRIIYVGRMSDAVNLIEKSPLIVLRIVSRLASIRRDFKVIMVGDGPGLKNLAEYVKSKGIEGFVEFKGYLPLTELPKLYSESIISMNPTYLDEFNPLWDGSLKESFACETPVVAFHRGGGELRIHKFGFTLSVDSSRAAKALSELIDDKKLLSKVALSGKRFVLKNCEWNGLIKKLVEIYEGLIEGKV